MRKRIRHIWPVLIHVYIFCSIVRLFEQKLKHGLLLCQLRALENKFSSTERSRQSSVRQVRKRKGNKHGWRGDFCKSVQTWVCRLLDRCNYQLSITCHSNLTSHSLQLENRAYDEELFGLESPAKHWFWEDLRFQSKPHPQTLTLFAQVCTNASPGHGSRWTPCPSRWEDTSGGCMELLPCPGCSQWTNMDGLKTNKNDIIFSDGQWEGRRVGAVVIGWCVL